MNLTTIPFNKPYFTGKENLYISEAIQNGKISGDGLFTQKCHQFFEEKYQFKKCLMTTSCSDALEMCAILLDIKAGDEIIAPSYTFVSTVNAFILRGAKIVFADSEVSSPNIDVSKIENLITNKTKAIVIVHYAGIACDMDALMYIAQKHQLYVVEDAAQAVDSYCIYNNERKPLGSIGHLSTFSFHETKNIISGEGGMLVINDEKFIKRAEVIREKGTNRSAFFRGEVDKYVWIDVGSSFLPSDMIAAFLYAQFESLDDIQQKRKMIWDRYAKGLKALENKKKIKLPFVPYFAFNNAHMFYIICDSLDQRTKLINYLKSKKISSVFHYLSLHNSPYYQEKHDGRELHNSDKYTDTLLRLPFYCELSQVDQDYVIDEVNNFFIIND